MNFYCEMCKLVSWLHQILTFIVEYIYSVEDCIVIDAI